MTQYNNTQIVQWYLQCNSRYINNVMSNITSIATLQGSIPIHGNPLHTICFWQSAMIQNVGDFETRKKTKHFLMGVVWPEMTGPGPPDEAFVGGKVAFGLGGEVMWHHATNPTAARSPDWDGMEDETQSEGCIHLGYLKESCTLNPEKPRKKDWCKC